jgi:hypothetical protein
MKYKFIIKSIINKDIIILNKIDIKYEINILKIELK